MREDEGVVLDGEHAALHVIDVATTQLVEIAHVAVGGGATAALAMRGMGTQGQHLKHGPDSVLEALMIVVDREVTDVVHLPRRHAASTRIDPGIDHGP